MRLWVFNLTLLLVLLGASSSALAAPATVDTSTSAQATANSSQRKTFFDSLNNTHWAFYYNGAAIEYSYSADGVAWTSAGTLAYDTASFSVVYKTISGVSYVFIVVEANTYDIVLRRGAIGTTSITFDAEQTVLNGSGSTDLYTKPTLALSENNHLWVSAIKSSGVNIDERYFIAVRRSTNVADGMLNVFNAEIPLGKRTSILKEAVIMPQNGDGMYAISSTDGRSIVGYTFDGSEWSNANTGGDFSWFGFGGANDLTATVYAIVVSGTDIYVGGHFTDAGNVLNTSKIARWDTTTNTWNALGTGIGTGFTEIVYAITVSGNDVYVGGQFDDAGGNVDADRIARWDGSSWHALGSGINNGRVEDIAVLGNDVYVGGSFVDTGGIAAADNIVRWDGNSWHALGAGLGGVVYAIAISGTDIYVGGSFVDAGGIAAADRIARWNGIAWSALGSGISNNAVFAIAITGTDIYVGGNFTSAGGVANTARIARWTGAAWSAVGSGIANGIVRAIAISGTDVYLSGSFWDVGGNPNADGVVRRDTSNNTWNAIDTGIGNNNVFAIGISGSDIYFGGSFSFNPSYLVRRDTVNNTWNRLMNGPVSNAVSAIAILGSDVYVGGINDAGGIPEADGIARWDGNSWHALGSGLNGGAIAITISGADVYVGGDFTNAGGNPDADYIARWDGANWHALGTGISGGGYVRTITVSGTDVYVGGGFTDAGGNADADYIAKWDGVEWIALSTAMSPGAWGSQYVTGIGIIGSDVYIVGEFSNVNGVAGTDQIARWDGTNWHALGSGLNSPVEGLAVSGTNVYVAGAFSNAGGIAEADRIARWDGNSWNALGNGITVGYPATIVVVGSDVYVGGNFSDVGGIVEADGIARWDGSVWHALDVPLSAGYSHAVNQLTISGSTIFVSGLVNISGTNKGVHLAYYTQTAAADAGSDTSISTTSDSDGNIYLSYTNDNNEVRFRRFDESDAEWGETVTLNATASITPAVTYKNNDGRVTTSWVESNAVSFRHAVSPYAAADWKAETTFYNTGTNVAVTAVGNQEADDLQLVWTNGAANPYNIYSDTIDMSTVPTVAVTSTATSPTNTSPIPITVQFSEVVTGFVVGDIAVVNGTAGNFIAVDGDTYTADITPTGQGAVSVDVAAGAAKDSFDNDNAAATQFLITYDTTAPTVAVSSTVPNPTGASPIPVTFQFSETVTGFAIGDIVVGNGNAGNFVAVDGDTYTVEVTPTADGAVTVDVAGAVAEDAAENDNTAAVQFSRVYDTTLPTVGIVAPAGPVTLANVVSFALSGSCSENGRAVALSATSSGGGAAVVASPNCGAGAWSASLNLSGLNDGTVTITADHEDAVGLDAVQASQTVSKETAAPSVVISSNLSSPTNEATIPIMVLFSEAVTGFAQGDISVTNATLGGFTAVNAQQYRATLTPTAVGAVTVNIGSGVAQDSVGNGNTAAAQFSITYELESEITVDTVCSVWNSFFNNKDAAVWNILEHVNTGSEEIAIETTLYSRDGVAQSSVQFTFSPAQRQLDLLVHDMHGWAPDSYGLVCSKVTSGDSNDLDGRMVYYRQKQLGGFEYVFASPFSRGTLGNQYVGFNTFQPSLNTQDSNNFVANWIQITNLENAAQSGQLRFYSQSGELLKSQSVTVPGIGQSDISAHDWDFPMVGLVQWQPVSETARFIVRNTRYLYDNAEMQDHFAGVVQVQAGEGSREMLSAIFDTQQASSVLELANVTEGEVQSKVKFYNSEGEVLADLDFTVPRFGTQHVIADAILQEDFGSVTVVVPEAEEKSLIATVLQYGRESSGSIEYLNGVEGLKPVGDVLRSSYNTFLNQGCELYLFNQGSVAQTATISMQRQNGTQVFADSELTLQPLQSVVSNLCAAEGEESYGMVTVTTAPEARFYPLLLRKDMVGGERYSVPVR